MSKLSNLHAEQTEKMVVAREPTVAAVAGLKSKTATTAPAESADPDRLTFRSALPQVAACLSAQTSSFLTGSGMAYSSALIPQLEVPESDIPITRQEGAWLASALVLTVPVGALLGGMMTDVLGRVNTMRLFTLPYVAACITIATATSFTQILMGRLLMGVALGVIVPTAFLYITEVTDKRLRGGLSCVGLAVASLGMLLGYVAGAFLDWRKAAWTGCVAPVITLVLISAFTVESPVWLRSRGRLHAARKSSMYLYSDPDKASVTVIAMCSLFDQVMSIPSAPSSALQDPNGTKTPPSRSVLSRFALLLGQPSGYKPMVIINSLFIIQQFTGIYITIFFAVTFFQEVGSDLDPYMSTILIGVVRLVGSLVCIFIMSHAGRRMIMMVSAVGMSVSMGVTSYATWRIQAGDDMPSWVVVAGVLMYVTAASFGFQTIPWTMVSELFPHEVRSLAQAVNSATAHVYIFAVLTMYPVLSHALGGAAGVQCFFAVVCLASALFVWIFLPETCAKSLAEIEEYFRHNFVFLGQKSGKNGTQIKIISR